MPYADAAGGKLCFEETGQGNPIIFVHESGSNLRAWEDQVRYFSRGYRRVTTLDARRNPLSDVRQEAALYSNTEFTTASGSVTAEPLRTRGAQQ